MLVWEWAQADEKEKPPMHPILHMGHWLFDIQASRLSGRNEFRLPYPGGSWIKEKSRNQYLLYLMDFAKRAAIVAQKSKEGKKLSKEENELFEEIAEAIAARND